MTNRLKPILKALIVLFIALQIHISAAAQVDESWDPVFNFQRKLAEQGNVKAQFILGEMYEQGRGVEKNYDTAIAWYQKAEQNGHQKATARIARIKDNIKQAALAKIRTEAEEKRKAKEKARQLALQKQRAAEERRRQQAREQARKEELAQQKEDDKKLSPEERAKKIKEAQERAQAIAKQNALRQQQQAEAQLRSYRATLGQTEQTPNATTANTKYQDPFE